MLGEEGFGDVSLATARAAPPGERPDCPFSPWGRSGRFPFVRNNQITYGVLTGAVDLEPGVPIHPAVPVARRSGRRGTQGREGNRAVPWLRENTMDKATVERRFPLAYDASKDDGGLAALKAKALSREGADEAAWMAMTPFDQEAMLSREYAMYNVAKLDSAVRDETLSAPSVGKIENVGGAPAASAADAAASAAANEKADTSVKGVDADNAAAVAEQRRMEALKAGGSSDPFATAALASENAKRGNERIAGDMNTSAALPASQRPTFATDAVLKGQDGVATGVVDQERIKGAAQRPPLTDEQIADLKARGEWPEDVQTEDMSVDDRIGRLERMMGIPGPVPRDEAPPLTDRVN